MKANGLITMFFRLTHALVVAMLLLWPIAAPGDQAQYFYDELGRLVGVVDEQGNAAVYNYDEVGNLLSVQRFTTVGAGVGILLVAPGSAPVEADVEILGFGLSATRPLGGPALDVFPTVVRHRSTPGCGYWSRS